MRVRTSFFVSRPRSFFCTRIKFRERKNRLRVQSWAFLLWERRFCLPWDVVAVVSYLLACSSRRFVPNLRSSLSRMKQREHTCTKQVKLPVERKAAATLRSLKFILCHSKVRRLVQSDCCSTCQVHSRSIETCHCVLCSTSAFAVSI